ncbi:MAG: diguanylate cyclase [Desulfobacteraceae bacterium]|jgi:diguanylate cyclase (GGDEF)-like protein
MINVIKDGYDILESLAETERSRLIRVRHRQNSKVFLLKTLKWGNPGTSDKARFFKEYESLKALDHDGVVKIFDHFTDEEGINLILEDCGGIPLSTLIRKSLADIPTFLSIAIRLSETLGFLHQKKITHGRIKPANILILGDKAIKITDFGVNALITAKADEHYLDKDVLAALSTMSPEQTGRMNRPVDYRTDLYSLGLTLFEMATGIVPFRSRDPLELIHCHLAITPENPALLRPELPIPLCRIILKLLEKAPEERYQNAFGLKSDLERCLTEFLEKERVDDFKLGRNDIADTFIIPQKLYGRANEVRTLMESFERVCQGEKRAVLVTGGSGIGKSALVQEIHKPIVQKRGYFLEGKYEPYKKDAPYSAIFQAVIRLIRQILKESENEINIWKDKILATLGENTALMTAVFPELTYITGAQPESAPAEPEETRNRFIRAFTRFISLFSTRSHPLVFFLDDMQWADFASLHFLKSLMTSQDMSHVLFIFSYRDEELKEGHPLHELLREMEKNNIIPKVAHLTPLHETDVTALVSDFLKCSVDKAQNLGSQIFKKTAGNPFFINQFLKTLYDGGKIWLDPVDGFQWNDEDINAMRVTDNVVDLMADKISKLPADTFEILKICACIGNRFDLETIADVTGRAVSDVFSSLKLAIDQGYLKIVNNLFFYHHDRIHEAAYSLIPEQERTEYHYKIGRTLLSRLKNTPDLTNQLMYITDQLNMAKDLIDDPSEKIALSNLNYISGLKAKNSAAYIPALHYFKTAASLLGPGAWTDNYRHILSVYDEIAETACVNQEYDAMTEAADTVTLNARTFLDQTRVYEAGIRACFHVQDFLKALSKGLSLLKWMGLPFPAKPSSKDVVVELIRVKWALRRITFQGVENLPVMKDEQQLAMSRLIMMLILPAAPVNSKLFALLVLKLVHKTLIHGRNLTSAMAFAAFGGLVVSVMGDRRTAIMCGDLALRLGELPEGRMMKHRANVVYDLYVRHWKENLPACHAASEKSYALAREAGDLLFTGISLAYGDFIALVMAHHLGEFRASVLARTQITETTNHLFMIQMHRMILQFVVNLNENTPDPTRLKGQHFDEDSAIPMWEKKNNFSGLFYYYTLKTLVLYLFGQYEQTEKYILKARTILPMARSIFVAVFFNYFDILSCLARSHGLSDTEKRKVLTLVDKKKKKLGAYATLESSKHEPWFHLINAEKAWLKGQPTTAMTCYGQALAAFKALPSPPFYALTCERAALFYRSQNQPLLEKTFIKEALKSLSDLDMKALVKKITNDYPDMAKERYRDERSQSATGHDRPAMAEELDLATVMKSAQALSGEIVLNKLLSTIMNISIESAGARKGFLILARKEGLFIEAGGTVDRQDVGVLQSLAVDQSESLSQSVVNYVARTLSIVVLDDAAKEGDFATDPYIRARKVRSLMAAPMVNSGILKGIIYLENNLASHVFNAERLKILDLLFSQAAIALENAQLFADVKKAEKHLRQFNVELERRVEERTSELTAAYEKIKVMAHTDPLTGLPNRRYMLEKIRHETARVKRNPAPFALVIGDIDHFKTFNDNHGHDCGDAVLVNLARLLSGILREQDQVARWGGEEFLFLFPDTDRDGAINVAEKIRQTVATSDFTFNSLSLAITMTLGVSVCDNPEHDIDHYLKEADQALYKGKNSGRNQVVVWEP